MSDTCTFIHPLTARRDISGDRLKWRIDFDRLSGACDHLIDDNREDVSIGDNTFDDSVQHFLRNFELLRRMKSMVWLLPKEHFDASLPSQSIEAVNQWGATSFLFVFPNGDICCVTRLQNDSISELIDIPDLYRRYFAKIQGHVCERLCEIGIQDPRLIVDFDRPVHTVFATPRSSDVPAFWARCFMSEGQDIFESQVSLYGGLDFCIFTGWSYSSIQRSDFGEEYLFVSLMLRLQLYWLELRDLRSLQASVANESLDMENSRDLAKKIELVGDASFNLDRRIQREQDLRANLKPWLRTVWDHVSVIWLINEDIQILKESNSATEKYLSSKLQSKRLFTDRFQSGALVVIAALDSFALFGLWVNLLEVRQVSSHYSVPLHQLYSENFFQLVLALNLFAFLIICIIGFFAIFRR